MDNLKTRFKEEIKFAFKEITFLFKSKLFWFGFLFYISAVHFGFACQSYLYRRVSNHALKLPLLHDLILDNIPFLEISFLYDWATLFGFITFLIYIICKKKYRNIPYYFMVFGLFTYLRSIFIILTPFGHPRNGIPTQSIFKGFSRYELGVFPSGHTGSVFLEFTFSKGIYKKIILFLLCLVIISMFLARGHYSIDILSGLIFSYAVYHFSEKNLKGFMLRNSNH